MNPTDSDPAGTLQVFEPATNAVYSIESVALLTGAPRHRIAVYCRHGLIAPLAAPAEAGWIFDADTIRTVRRIEVMRLSYGLNLAGLRMISELLRDMEELSEEVRFWRGR